MSKRFNPRSLRFRIVLLASFACLLLIAAGTSFYFFLGSSQAAKLDAAQKHLVMLANALRSDYYASQNAHGFRLQDVDVEGPPHPDGLAKGMRPDGTPPPPPPPPAPPVVTGDTPLSKITASVLRRESDVEGGFYSAQADTLVGYDFPTHEGPGGKREIPGKERPAIEAIARQAVSADGAQKESFHGAYDAILLVAVPIRSGNEVIGAAWLMQRMPGLEAGRSSQLLLGSLGFTAAAIACILLTLFITSEVNTGVQTVLNRLGKMEGDLGEHGESGTRPQLAEFQTVLERVDRLSDTLKQKIETQRALEDEVRHRQRLSALGQFAAGVAHELRNPLATIRLRTQMSQRAQEGGAVERNCDVVLHEITRLDSMIERLLYFSRPIHLKREPVPVHQLCAELVERWADRCRQNDIELFCGGPADFLLFCDAGAIRQVLDNLLDNAVQAIVCTAKSAGRIEIRYQASGNTATLTVTDSGDGLTSEAEDRALEPFFTTREAGTGLGLSISYEIAQAHGGDLRLRGQPGGGAVATLTLPLEEQQEELSSLKELAR